MNFVVAILSPIALMLPVAGAVEANQDIPREVGNASQEASETGPRQPSSLRAAQDAPAFPAVRSWPFSFVSQGFRPESAFQVRIERQVTIRVAPRAKNVRPNMFTGVPNQAIGPKFVERRMGKCLPVSRLAGVQPNGGKSLILFMRDHKIVSAQLERACRARDFYSGFYLSRSSDGRLCVDRDKLQSRSGANCKLTRIRQLIAVED